MRFRRAFEGMKATTSCPFARNADVVYASSDVVVGSRIDLGDVPTELEAFLGRYRTERLDGFVWSILGVGGETLSDAAELFARTVAALRRADDRPPLYDWAGIGSTDWQFSFAGEPLFLNLFSGCYPADHSKHVPIDGGIVVFAQPEDAFDFCGVDATRRTLKLEIRRRFAEAGSAYDGELIDARREAELYVFPMRLGDPPVRWWTLDVSGEGAEVL